MAYVSLLQVEFRCKISLYGECKTNDFKKMLSFTKYLNKQFAVENTAYNFERKAMSNK